MKMSLGKRVDATQNGIIRGIIIYAIPLVISALIQNAFNAVDLAVLGQMANEEAVAMYLNDEIGFYDIYDLVSRAVEAVPFIANPTLEQILEADKLAREAVRREIKK